jgi:hypothetical protein
VAQEQNPRERSFISELVPDLRSTRVQVLWAIRITLAVVLALTVVSLLGLEQQPKELGDAIMPNGQEYIEWLENKGRREEGENSASS